MKRKTKMKKMMMFAAAIAVAAVAQAASINWTVAANSWTLADGSKAATGTAVYLIDAAYLADITSAINGGATSFKAGDTGIIAVGATSNTKGYIAASTATSSALVAGESYNFAYLVIDGDQYFVSGTTTKAAYDTSIEEYKEAQLVTFNATSFSSSASGWQTAVPEPTSALLLVLGGALLALRRKRA